MQKQIKLLHSLVCAAGVTVFFIAGITISAELFTPIKDWLKTTFSHHWLGKGALSLLLFSAITIAGYFWNFTADARGIAKRTMLLFFVSSFSAIVLLLFCGYEAFMV